MAGKEDVNPDLYHIKTYKNKNEYITHSLQPDEIIGALLSEEVITQKAYQQIQRKITHNGPIVACELLLSDSLMRNPNPESFFKFIDVLRVKKQEFLAGKLMEEYDRIRQSCQNTRKRPEVALQRCSKPPVQQSQQVAPGTTHSPNSSRTPVMQEDGSETSSGNESKQAMAIAAGDTTNPNNDKPVDVHDLQDEYLVTPGLEEQAEVPRSELDQAEPSLLQSLNTAATTPEKVVPDAASSGACPLSPSVAAPNHQPTLANLKIDPNQLKFDRNKPLGAGRFGHVYHCDYLGTIVAVKELAQNISKKALEKRVTNNKEIIGSAAIRHPHVVQFMGYSIGKMNTQSVLLLVFELVDGENLNTILHGDDQSVIDEYELNDQIRYKIAKHICQAIVFIHEKNIIHRDIKPSNILVTKSHEAKLCDLGLCKLKEGSPLVTTMGKPQGTPVYMAHELILKDKKPATFASDVFSFGASLYELFYGDYMWGIDVDDDEGLKELMESMQEERVPAGLQNATGQPKTLLAQCVHYEPGHRPAASKVLDTLNELSDKREPNAE